MKLLTVLFFVLGSYRLLAIDVEEARMLVLINNYRAANSRGALIVSEELQHAARWMSYDIARTGASGHVDSFGRTPAVRAVAFGFPITFSGENIQGGAEFAQGAFDAWVGSTGHRANLLSPNWTHVGIGRAYVPTGLFRWYWTAAFGARFGAPPIVSPPPPPVIPPLTPSPPPIVLPPPATTPPSTGLDTYTAMFDAGVYSFTIMTPYGLRVSVDDEVFFERWRELAPTTFRVNRYMTAGQHVIRVEHYQLNPVIPIAVTWSKLP